VEQENGVKQYNDVQQENGVDKENVFVFWSLVFCLLGSGIFFFTFKFLINFVNFLCAHIFFFTQSLLSLQPEVANLRRQKNTSFFECIFSVGGCTPLCPKHLILSCLTKWFITLSVQCTYSYTYFFL